MMGIAASASSILCCFMNCKKLTQNAETVGSEGKREEESIQQAYQHTEAIGMTPATTINFAG